MNKVGKVLGPDAVVPLDETSLLAAAKTATGLDDFGPDESWREPFGILVNDIANESNLNLTGRVLARFDLVRALATLLRLAAREKRHPEILDQSHRGAHLHHRAGADRDDNPARTDGSGSATARAAWLRMALSGRVVGLPGRPRPPGWTNAAGRD